MVLLEDSPSAPRTQSEPHPLLPQPKTMQTRGTGEQHPPPPELGLGGAENTIIILHVRTAVTGVVHVQCVVQQIQVLLHFRDVLGRVLL